MFAVSLVLFCILCTCLNIQSTRSITTSLQLQVTVVTFLKLKTATSKLCEAVCVLVRGPKCAFIRPRKTAVIFSALQVVFRIIPIMKLVQENIDDSFTCSMYFHSFNCSVKSNLLRDGCYSIAGNVISSTMPALDAPLPKYSGSQVCYNISCAL